MLFLLLDAGVEFHLHTGSVVHEILAGINNSVLRISVYLHVKSNLLDGIDQTFQTPMILDDPGTVILHHEVLRSLKEGSLSQSDKFVLCPFSIDFQEMNRPVADKIQHLIQPDTFHNNSALPFVIKGMNALVIMRAQIEGPGSIGQTDCLVGGNDPVLQSVQPYIFEKELIVFFLGFEGIHGGPGCVSNVNRKRAGLSAEIHDDRIFIDIVEIMPEVHLLQSYFVENSKVVGVGSTLIFHSIPKLIYDKGLRTCPSQPLKKKPVGILIDQD